ncbi:MAG: SCP-2 sterol transfer family protein [Actinobacteria bacterium]|nr:SCP-2 sterol transfer family protein [Actinomycetota bacterium]
MPAFLSDEWMRAAKEIYAAHPDGAPASTEQMQINLVVSEAPFGDGTIQAHLDTTGPQPEIDLGHIDGAPTTIMTDYATAKSVFVGQDQQAAMQAFMGGKIRITGDMTKLMMLMQGTPDPAALEIASAIQAVTD